MFCLFSIRTFSYSCHLDSHPSLSLTIVFAFSRRHPAPPIVLARSRLGTVGLFLVHFHLMKARGTLPKRRVRTNVTWWLCEIVVGELWAREKPPWYMTPLVCRDSVPVSLPSIVESFSGLLRKHQALSLIQRVSHSLNEVQTPHTWCILFQNVWTMPTLISSRRPYSTAIPRRSTTYHTVCTQSSNDTQIEEESLNTVPEKSARYNRERVTIVEQMCQRQNRRRDIDIKIYRFSQVPPQAASHTISFSISNSFWCHVHVCRSPVHKHTPIHKHTYTHLMHTYTHAHTQTHIHSHKHTYTHIHYTHAHTHTHIRTHKQTRVW